MKLNRGEALALLRAVQIALDESTVSARPKLSADEQTMVENIGIRIVETMNRGELDLDEGVRPEGSPTKKLVTALLCATRLGHIVQVTENLSVARSTSGLYSIKHKAKLDVTMRTDEAANILWAAWQEEHPEAR
jgi:hypothetical protein